MTDGLLSGIPVLARNSLRYECPYLRGTTMASPTFINLLVASTARSSGSTRSSVGDLANCLKATQRWLSRLTQKSEGKTSASAYEYDYEHQACHPCQATALPRYSGLDF